MSRVKDIGQLKTRIRIQVFDSNVADDGMFGYEKAENEDWMTLWAKIDLNRGDTLNEGGQIGLPNVTMSATVRYNQSLYDMWSRLGAASEVPLPNNPDGATISAITAKMLVTFNGRTFKVKSLIDPDGDRKWIEIGIVETWKTT